MPPTSEIHKLIVQLQCQERNIEREPRTQILNQKQSWSNLSFTKPSFVRWLVEVQKRIQNLLDTETSNRWGAGDCSALILRDIHHYSRVPMRAYIPFNSPCASMHGYMCLCGYMCFRGCLCVCVSLYECVRGSFCLCFFVWIRVCVSGWLSLCGWVCACVAECPFVWLGVWVCQASSPSPWTPEGHGNGHIVTDWQTVRRCSFLNN